MCLAEDAQAIPAITALFYRTRDYLNQEFWEDGHAEKVFSALVAGFSARQNIGGGGFAWKERVLAEVKTSMFWGA